MDMSLFEFDSLNAKKQTNKTKTSIWHELLFFESASGTDNNALTKASQPSNIVTATVRIVFLPDE